MASDCPQAVQGGGVNPIDATIERSVDRRDRVAGQLHPDSGETTRRRTFGLTRMVRTEVRTSQDQNAYFNYYGDANYDVRQRFSFSGLYTIPGLKSGFDKVLTDA